MVSEADKIVDVVLHEIQGYGHGMVELAMPLLKKFVWKGAVRFMDGLVNL